MDITGKGKLLKIYFGELQKWKGQPLYIQLINKLKEEDIAGVTLYQGIIGYGCNKKLHSAKILDLSANLPMVLEAVDTETNITRILPLVKEMVTKGLIFTVEADIAQYGPYKGKSNISRMQFIPV